MQKAIEHYQDLTARVVEGEIDALVAYGNISTTIKALQALEEVIKEKAMKDAEHQEKKFTHFGFAFEKLAPRRMVNYKNVPQWADLKARQERIEKLALTAATQFGATVVDEETGEVIPAAEIKYTKESLSVKPTK
jgi:polyhydroxyalkanoate synthesis regulator phasin